MNSTPNEDLIVIDSVVKRYSRGGETITVLDNLQMEIAEGDFVALMGPSGSGKTTLLNLIAGIDRPDSGTVRVAGTLLQSLGENELASWRSKNVGFVFQFYNLIPVLTALENVCLPLTLFPMSKGERLERGKFALNLVGLSDRESHRPKQLSGGQEQRVAIARAIVSDPRFIVADEPTGDLDRKSAGDILELLQRLNCDLKKTIVMVTHDPAAAGFAKRTVNLDKGKLVSLSERVVAS